jgi:hypothetical protein
MKAMKIIALAIIAVSFVSCDIFLAPQQGRFNPADPSTALVAANRTLGPIADGYVWGPSANKDFTNTYFNAGMDNFGLIKFDLSGLPPIIVKAELKLFNQNAVTVSNAKACKILQPWDPATVTYLTVTGGGFFNATAAPTITVPMSNFGVWDVTQLVKEGAINGLCITSTDPSAASFISMENGSPNKPQLIITGFTYP